MDFFANQDKARRNTRTLVVLYVLAVLAIVIAVDLVLVGVWLGSGFRHYPFGTTFFYMLQTTPWEIYIVGAICAVVAIGTVSVLKINELSEGGAVVAEMVGARLVPSDTKDPLEKRLLNVVEEMAIAAGVRVPQAYVMDNESGINAFAAGYDVGNSIVAVTRGTLHTLNRDELQGVIGHEFSHILNGDMRLNLNMIGILAGIVFIGGIGNFLMRMTPRTDRDNRAGIGIFVAGLMLFLIGYLGLFFARLIKAGISRQREFLADASSVQFTRNPDGIAGALYRIKETGNGTLIENRHAESMSHMFFGQGIDVWFGMFDTHPPVDERITRVHPGFQPSSYIQKRAATDAPELASSTAVGQGTGAAGGAVVNFLSGATVLGGVVGDGKRRSDQGTAWGRDPKQSAQLVGTLDAGKVDQAQRLLARLPEELRSSMRTPEGAAAVVVVLLLARAPDVRELQLSALRAAGYAAIGNSAQILAPMVQQLGRAYDLLLVDLALPALKGDTAESRQCVITALEIEIHTDRRVSVHAFAVYTFVKTQLTGSPSAAVKYRTITSVRDEVCVVLSVVAHAGRQTGPDPALDREVESAFAAGAAAMGITDAKLLPVTGFNMTTVSEALEKLQYLAPLSKATLIKGLFAAVTFDGTIRVMEAELMRMIGAALDCPLPPLLNEIDPETLAA